MSARTLSPLLATTLIALATPQLAHAAQPEAGADASVGASVGTDTTTDTTATADTTAEPAPDVSTTTTVAVVPVANSYNVEGKWRLHFDVDFLVQPRPNDLQDIAATQIIRPFYGLGFGYGIHKNFVIGAKLAFNFTRVRDRSDEALDNDVLAVQRTSAGSFTPYVEYLPLADRRIQPFVGFKAGFAWATDTTRTKSDAGDMGLRNSEIGPMIGLSAGAHFFLTPSFSLDAAALFDTRWAFSRARQLGDGAMDPASWAPSASIMSLGLGLGMSGWF